MWFVLTSPRAQSVPDLLQGCLVDGGGVRGGDGDGESLRGTSCCGRRGGMDGRRDVEGVEVGRRKGFKCFERF